MRAQIGCTENDEADKHIGSGKKLQDTVRVTIERTLSLLSQHLVSKNAHNLAMNNRAPQSRPTASIVQTSAPAVYSQSGAYQSYEQPSYSLSNNNQSQLSGQAAAYIPPPSVTTHTTSVTYQNPPPYPYQPPYTSNPQTFDQQSYAQPNTLPATAAAANAYMSSYQQPQQAPTSYQSNHTFQNTANFQGPESPSSWRQFAGNMTSNIDPGPDYMSSASALMQRGRSEGPPPQDLQLELDLQQGDNMNGGPQQAWPFLLFENGQGVG